jgi:hypothetical protein
MWCDQCRQDVPATASRDQQTFCCPRCGGGLPVQSCGQPGDAAPDHDQPGTAEAGWRPPLDDGWELDQQLEHIERVLSSRKAGSPKVPPAEPREVARLDPPHAGPSAWHLPPAGKPARGSKPSPPPSYYALAVLTWVALSLGTTAFVCGGMLLGWSLVTGREELWAIGLPVALCGQIALLVGLVLQLDRLRHDSRHAAAKLDDVDQQLHELKTATTMLGTSHSSPASAFYSHLAGGANSQLLLTDLKSQLDLLALKIGQQE